MKNSGLKALILDGCVIGTLWVLAGAPWTGSVALGGEADSVELLGISKWTNRRVNFLSDITGYKPVTAPVTTSAYGGKLDRKVKATGFFRTEKVDGRWWFVDPLGYLFFSVGLNHVRPTTEQLEPSANLVVENGFNTLSESYETWPLPRKVPYTRGLMVMYDYLMTYHRGEYGPWHYMPLWEPELITFIEKKASSLMPSTKDDPYLLGWYIDNERWFYPEVLDSLLLLPKESASYKAVAAWVTKEGYTPGPKGYSWEARDNFLEYYCDYFAKITTSAMRRHDPNHLILGARFRRQDIKHPGTIRGFGPHIDVITLNYYGSWPADPVITSHLSAWAGDRPIMITEFFAQGLDVNPAYQRDGHIVRTQEDRGKFYSTYALAAFQIPELVGIHWFAFKDGDTSNWGIVDKDYKPYTALLSYMKPLNINVYPLMDYLARNPEDLSWTFDAFRKEIPEIWDDGKVAIVSPAPNQTTDNGLNLSPRQTYQSPVTYFDMRGRTMGSLPPRGLSAGNTGGTTGCGVRITRTRNGSCHGLALFDN